LTESCGRKFCVWAVVMCLDNSTIRQLLQSVGSTYICRVDIILWWNAKKLPKSTLIEGHATVGGVAYRQKVVRYTQQPYMFKYSHQTEIITGIAFVPLSSKYQSPEGDVIEGGVNWNNVTICRTTVQSVKWACDVPLSARKTEPTTEPKVRPTLALPDV